MLSDNNLCFSVDYMEDQVHLENLFKCGQKHNFQTPVPKSVILVACSTMAQVSDVCVPVIPIGIAISANRSCFCCISNLHLKAVIAANLWTR